MTRVISARIIGAFALFSAAAVGGAVFGVPEYLARQALEAAESCHDLTERDRRCRFVGGPLEMAGAPVFMENFQQAFLPTRQQIDFVDAKGETWTAPPRTLTDGASIPTIFAPLVGDRQSREYLIAAALHDAYCGVGNEGLDTYWARPWQEVHRMFYEALLVNGTPPQKAKLMFAAVYLGGPRWDDPERDLGDVSEAALLQEMEWCLEWIRTENPSADEIEAWMDEREKALKEGRPSVPDYIDAHDPRGL
ncbi:DUF1353 domain-containing protein [Pseudoponticoccus marisrubri]|uniref:DUF1353 domain-containing protein n=1 Tax=Pseudoponticoccus marisrubri TaxID=1685382 RepID=A0A0W7WFD4_9RHOB|nr:DUF1353 domain-containing protein [Pseudoponticoccus marisrubri]KUF09266.1 hypothetical protein AVJ23_18605 [Pseudoponticoccus marisrubri]